MVAVENAGKPTTVRKHYEIVTVRHVKPPPGAEGSNWHRYEIAQGSNTIHGYRQGDLAAVMAAVEENVAQLNERQFGIKRS